MNNKEAIEWLRLDIDMIKFDPMTGEDAYLNDDAKKVIEAMETAISALEKQDIDKLCETCKHKKRSSQESPCCDCYMASVYEDCYEAEEDND